MQAGTSHSAVNGRSKASFPQREQGVSLVDTIDTAIGVSFRNADRGVSLLPVLG